MYVFFDRLYYPKKKIHLQRQVASVHTQGATLHMTIPSCFNTTYMYVRNGTYFIPKSELFLEIQGGKGLRLTLKYDTGFKIMLKTD